MVGVKSQVVRVLSTGLLIGLGCATAEASIIAGPIRNPTNGHLYYLLTPPEVGWSETGFNQSQLLAESMGGNLVTINDEAENTWIFDTFAPLIPGGVGVIGLGLNDFETEGNYVWTSGETPGYFNWDPNSNGPFGPQPDGDPDDVVGMVFGFWNPGYWHDFNTDPSDDIEDLKPFLLVEVDPVPEPGTIAVWSILGLCGIGYGVRRKMKKTA